MDADADVSIQDHVRGRMMIHKWSDAPRVIEALKEAGFDVQLKEHASGYKGIHAVGPMEEGYNGEIQIHTPESWALKEASDSDYRQTRSMDPTDPAQAKKMEVKEAKTRELYDELWGAVPDEDKAAISASLTRSESPTTSHVSGPGHGTQAPSTNSLAPSSVSSQTIRPLSNRPTMGSVDQSGSRAITEPPASNIPPGEHSGKQPKKIGAISASERAAQKGGQPAQGTQTLDSAGYGTASPFDLILDPDTFQYKSDHDVKTGSTGSLKHIKRWSRDLSGVVLTWVNPSDGKRYVVNGHNRVSRARELAAAGDESASQVIYKDIEAPDAERAKVIGAVTNIAEGKGTVVDAAKILRTEGITPEQMEAWGVDLTGRKARVGQALAGLSDDLFHMVINKKLSVDNGEIIGHELAGAPSVQMQLLKAISKTPQWKRSQEPHHIDNQKLQNWARLYAEGKTDVRRQEQGSLPGTDSGQASFGGLDDSFARIESRGEHTADLLTYVQKGLREDATIGRNISKRRAAELLVERGIDADGAKMGEAGAQARDQALLALDEFDRAWKTDYRQEIEQTADSLAEAKTPEERNTVLEHTYRSIRGQIEKTFTGRARDNRTGGESLPEGPRSEDDAQGLGGRTAAAGVQGAHSPPGIEPSAVKRQQAPAPGRQVTTAGTSAGALPPSLRRPLYVKLWRVELTLVAA